MLGKIFVIDLQPIDLQHALLFPLKARADGEHYKVSIGLGAPGSNDTNTLQEKAPSLWYSTGKRE